MNAYNRPPIHMSPIDILLSDVAIRIQLSQTDYDKAIARYETMQEWIDRPVSPLAGLVARMYAQGSMATGSTVAQNSDADEYDIDVMAELTIRDDSPPEVVLDTLFNAIRGEPGSRYYDMTVRHTRCVCVRYADGMHIDITPAVLIPSLQERTSWIFHHKQDAPNEPGYRLLANPYGLADYFNGRTPIERDFATFYEQRSLAYDRMTVEARAPGEPVPDQQPAYRKSRALISLQLLKRWRNVLFEGQARAKLRRPPSVLLSKLVADNAGRSSSLSGELHLQAKAILDRLIAEKSLGRLVHEVNPRCSGDVLTDRWPGDHAAQDLLIADLRDFCTKMEALRFGDLSLAQMSVILEELFGERPARSALNDYISRQGQLSRLGQAGIHPGTGRITGLITGVGGGFASGSSAARPVPAHNFYGGLARKTR